MRAEAWFAGGLLLLGMVMIVVWGGDIPLAVTEDGSSGWEVPSLVPAEAAEPNLTIEALRGRIDPGTCDGSGPSASRMTCHAVTIRMTNNNRERAVGTSALYWNAVFSDDREAEAAHVTGPDEIPPGRAEEVVVHFDADLESRVSQIRFAAMWMNTTLTSDVPTYG